MNEILDAITAGLKCVEPVYVTIGFPQRHDDGLGQQ